MDVPHFGPENNSMTANISQFRVAFRRIAKDAPSWGRSERPARLGAYAPMRSAFSVRARARWAASILARNCPV